MAEIVIRVTLIYFLILIGLRILGKREFGQLSPMEMITILIIPEIVSPALVRQDSLVNAVIGTTTILCIIFLISLVKHVSGSATRVLEGKPCILVYEGKLNADLMNRERVDADEVLEAMRRQGLERFSDIRWAVLEVDGSITVIPADGVRQGEGRNEDSRILT